MEFFYFIEDNANKFSILFQQNKSDSRCYIYEIFSYLPSEHLSATEPFLVVKFFYVEDKFLKYLVSQLWQFLIYHDEKYCLLEVKIKAIFLFDFIIMEFKNLVISLKDKSIVDNETE